MIIGITGPAAAGKDSVANYLVSKGFSHASLSNVIREEAKKRGVEFTRGNLIQLGNQLRDNFGGEYLAKLALKQAQGPGAKNLVLTSIRHPAELKFLKNANDFKLWQVTAPQDLRWQRAKNKPNSEDLGDFEEFKQWEEYEDSTDQDRQQLSVIASQADAEIINDKGLPELYRVIDELLEEEAYKLNSERISKIYPA